MLTHNYQNKSQPLFVLVDKENEPGPLVRPRPVRAAEFLVLTLPKEVLSARPMALQYYNTCPRHKHLDHTVRLVIRVWKNYKTLFHTVLHDRSTRLPNLHRPRDECSKWFLCWGFTALNVVQGRIKSTLILNATTLYRRCFLIPSASCRLQMKSFTTMGENQFLLPGSRKQDLADSTKRVVPFKVIVCGLMRTGTSS